MYLLAEESQYNTDGDEHEKHGDQYADHRRIDVFLRMGFVFHRCGQTKVSILFATHVM